MASDMGVRFLGRIPIDPVLGETCDGGRPYIHRYARTETGKAFDRIIDSILDIRGKPTEMVIATTSTASEKEVFMRIAIPVTGGVLSAHFGRCDLFALLDVDQKAKKILRREDVEAPPHQPGLLPPWLAERGVTMIIAGGMGQRAQGLFADQHIQVVVGAPTEIPEKIARDYLGGTLKVGENVCEH
jgi:ATP-binding protein involved in chromosome partitioning